MSVEFPIGNYYGAPYVEEHEGKYYLCVEDYSGLVSKEVSKEFYDACKKEF